MASPLKENKFSASQEKARLLYERMSRDIPEGEPSLQVELSFASQVGSKCDINLGEKVLIVGRRGDGRSAVASDILCRMNSLFSCGIIVDPRMDVLKDIPPPLHHRDFSKVLSMEFRDLINGNFYDTHIFLRISGEVDKKILNSEQFSIIMNHPRITVIMEVDPVFLDNAKHVGMFNVIISCGQKSWPIIDRDALMTRSNTNRLFPNSYSFFEANLDKILILKNNTWSVYEIETHSDTRLCQPLHWKLYADRLDPKVAEIEKLKKEIQQLKEKVQENQTGWFQSLFSCSRPGFS